MDLIINEYSLENGINEFYENDNEITKINFLKIYN